MQDRKVSKLSGGMVRRLGVAQALVGRPKLLIVDEPTVGLDPEERIKFRGLLQELEGDVTVILSTHIVADISSTCNGIALLDKGKIIFKGSPGQLLKQAEGKTWELEVDASKLEEVKKSFTVVTTSGKPDRMKIRVVGDVSEGMNMKPVDPTLEDAYIYFIDSFTKPVPISVDVAVDIDRVIDKKWRSLDSMESQFYEWLPWLDHRLQEVPASKQKRAEWLKIYLNDIFGGYTAACVDILAQRYGAERARRVDFAEGFELCEYGRMPSREELWKIFPY